MELEYSTYQDSMEALSTVRKTGKGIVAWQLGQEPDKGRSSKSSRLFVRNGNYLNLVYC